MMEKYYLKCEHCGFMNEVKSEYLVFCDQCGKKMEQNYSNWKNKNSGKQFEDYLKEVCYPESATKPVEKPVKENRPYIKGNQWLKIILGIVVIIIIAFVARKIMQVFLFPSLEKYTEKEWTLQDCGSLGLQVKSPLKLKPDNSIQEEVQGQTVSNIETIESYTASTFNDRLFIMANSYRYSPGVEGSLQGAVEGSLREMQRQPGISGFKYDITAVKHFDMPGALIKGKWNRGSNYYGFWQAIYVDKNVVWQVLIGYDLTDPYGEKIAEKVVQSISITPNIALLQINPNPLNSQQAPALPHLLSFL